jgi:hypothetical protein
MIATHPLTPAAGTLVVCAAAGLTALTAPAAVPAVAVAATAWVLLGVAAGYSISGSP